MAGAAVGRHIKYFTGIYEMNTIICGDAVEVMKSMPDESVHCCVTSPPYWGLRDYGIEGQLGLEKTPEEYVAKLVEIFREVRRVLRSDGVMFLNMGDTYWGDKGQSGRLDHNLEERKAQGRCLQKREWTIDTNKVPQDGKHEILKPKDLVGMPWRVAFALQADGWWLRSDIIWAKPNPMPESVRDRPTKSHEYLFLLTKFAKYYYDQEAIREASQDEHDRRIPDGFTTTWKQELSGDKATGRIANNGGKVWGCPTTGRNARSVWTIATQPFPEAHFATFPEKLVEPCIKAGTSEKGCCPKCGAGWVRIIERTPNPSKYANVGADLTGGAPNMGGNQQTSKGLHRNKGNAQGLPPTTLGWRPSCECDAGEPMPCIVLDPFAGSGTTPLVAKKLGRAFFASDLNPQYVEMANRRLAEAMPFFGEGD